MLTRDEAVTLGRLLHDLRPDWTPAQLLKLFEQHHAEHDIHELALPAVLAALEKSNRSPVVIFMQGKHWATAEAFTGQARAEHLRRAPQCEEHTGMAAHNCPSCRADVLVGERTRDQIGKRIHNLNPAPRPETASTPF